MTKARDLANIISGGFTADDIPNLDTSKLTTGELVNARVADLPTSKITSGTFADARISASSVNQHAASVDLTPVRHDITTLALRQAVNENKAAFNLPNSFIDQFEDDTGIGSETDCNRGDENVSTAVVTVSGTKEDYSGLSASSTSTAGGGYDAGRAFDDNQATQWADNSSETVPQYLSIDFGSGVTKRIVKYILYGYNSNSQQATSWEFKGSNTSSNLSTSGTIIETVTGHDWTAASSGVGNDGIYTSGVLENPNSYRYYGLNMTYIESGASYIYMDEFDMWTGTSTFNATGTLIGIANVPTSAQTKVSGVMNYKDLEGTATIGTDLKIYFTCDGGSNWTEANSYTAVTPAFSTGIKMVKLGETTCTSGSDVRYKAVWANQSAGSKETELHGIGINY